MRRPAKGERPLDWVGSSKDDLLRFPDPVIDEIGMARADIELIERRLKAAERDYAMRFGTEKE
jgi:phage-related protein